MALIKLTVDLTDPEHLKVVSNDVLHLLPGDRLQFETNPPGTSVAVKLGTTLFALVRNAGSNTTPGEFGVTYAPDGTAVIELNPPDVQGASPDPPS